MDCGGVVEQDHSAVQHNKQNPGRTQREGLGEGIDTARVHFPGLMGSGSKWDPVTV